MGKRKEKDPKKVNSLIYKDYTLFEREDGSKSYISPEEKTQLLLQNKIKLEGSKASTDNLKTETEMKETQLLLQNKIKLEGSKASLDNLKTDTEMKELDSDGDSVYEVPTTIFKTNRKENLDEISAIKPEIKTNKSISSFDWETSPGDNGRINLPPYIVPFETSLTYPMTKSKNKISKNKNKKKNVEKKLEQITIDEETEKNYETSLKNMNENAFDFPATFRVRPQDEDVVDTKKDMSFIASTIYWERNHRREKEMKDFNEKPRETDIDEVTTDSKDLPAVFKTPKKRFSVPWNKKLKNNQNEENDKPAEKFKKKKSFEGFFFKLPKLSMNNEKEKQEDKPEDTDLTKYEEDSNEVGNKYLESKIDESINDEPLKTPYDSEKESENKETLIVETPIRTESNSKGDLRSESDSENNDDLTSELKKLEEIFPQKQTSNRNSYIKILFDQNVDASEKPHEISENVENIKPYSYGFPVVKLPDQVLTSRDRKFKNKGRLDPNPLKKMFGIKKPKIVQGEEPVDKKSAYSGVATAKPFDEEAEIDKVPKFIKHKTLDVYDGNTSSSEPECVSYVYGPRKEYDTDSIVPKVANPYDDADLSGMVLPVDESASADLGSDTESADHGSTDKSSMSKLTSENQPKKIMNGLLGSFKKGKKQDIVVDNESLKNPPSFEITVKEQPEHGHMEGSRTEGIVYAELDMARSPGSVMRRDDEKTEYAEIIHPSSILSVERNIDDIRKSRENLTLSRENLTEVDEAYATTTTPDGKKEAAV